LVGYPGAAWAATDDNDFVICDMIAGITGGAVKQPAGRK